MRTLCISDIHIDVNRAYPVLGELASFARERQAECILLAGDVSGNIFTTMEAVKQLKEETGAFVYYIPGNHDMWRSEKLRLSTDEIYERFCQDENCLCGKSVRVGRHMVIGDIGWYDYSFGDKSFAKEDFDRLEQDGRVWQDKYYNQWTEDNVGRNEWFIKRLRRQLDSVTLNLREELPIVAVTHMLPHEAFTVPTEDRPMWKYFNAFLGSRALKELYEKYPVDHALCGHVHYRRDFTENRIRYMCRCLNYASEWRGKKEAGSQIRAAAEMIEL